MYCYGEEWVAGWFLGKGRRMDINIVDNASQPYSLFRERIA
jgi:hypothetical protein